MSKMKKATFVAAMLLACACMAFALTPSDLTAENRAKFDSQALSIQTSESTSYYSNYWGTYLYWDMVWDLAEDHPWYYWMLPYSVLTPAAYTSYGDRRIDWEPFRGFTKISKYDFYNSIGLPQEAERYRKFQNKVDTWEGLSWGGLIAGTGFLIAGLCVEDPLSTYFLVSAGAFYTASSIGFTVLEFGLVEEKEFSVSFAVNAAQTYNQRLLEDLAR